MCWMELSQPGRGVREKSMPLCAAVQAEVQTSWGINAPPRDAPWSLSCFLLNCRGIPRAPAGCRRSTSGARRVRQAALRCPTERKDLEPTLTSARPGWVVIPRPGAFTFACFSRPVSWGPLLVTSRSSPAANHPLHFSTCCSFCYRVPLALFLYPRGIGPGVTGPSPTRGAPTATLEVPTGHLVCHTEVVPTHS